MWKRIVLNIFGLVFITSLTASCIFDPEQKPGDGPPLPPPSYKDLTEKDDVLYNLQLLYPRRDVEEYQRLLEDDDYIFFFGENEGGEFEQYTKQQELETLRNMRDDTRPDAVETIELTLQYPKGEWTGTVPTDPKYEGETWYEKTVTYRLTVNAKPDMTYVGNDIKAQFTIRLGKDKDGSDIWRIIRWRDDVKL